MENCISHYKSILPIRIIPYWIGKFDSTSPDLRTSLAKHFEIDDDSPFLKNLSKDFYLRLTIDAKNEVYLYLYTFGVGIVVIKDEPFQITTEDFAIDYCKSRKENHKLLQGNLNKYSRKISTAINCIKNLYSTSNIGNEIFYPQYIFTLSILQRIGENTINFTTMNDVEKKNLLILLDPSIMHEEDSSYSVRSNKRLDTNFDLESYDTPKDFCKAADCCLYISWSSVVLIVNSNKGKDTLNYEQELVNLEIDLQAMWTYCFVKFQNTKDNNECLKDNSILKLREAKYTFKEKFSGFIQINDSSASQQQMLIRDELIRTSKIKRIANEYVNYIDYIIEEKDTIDKEKQKKYSIISEVLLYILAFLQIAPMIYKFIAGEIDDINILALSITTIIAVLGMIFIIKKE